MRDGFDTTLLSMRYRSRSLGVPLSSGSEFKVSEVGSLENRSSLRISVLTTSRTEKL